MTRFLIQALLIVVIFIAAWRAGGKPERYVASIYLCMLVGSSAHAFVAGPDADANYINLHGFRFMLDACAFAGVVFVALRYDRWWTLWVGSVQLIAVMAHFLRILEWPIPPIAYAVMERWPVWIAVLLTGLGTAMHMHRSHKTLMHA
jgi:hypothetical protein